MPPIVSRTEVRREELAPAPLEKHDCTCYEEDSDHGPHQVANQCNDPAEPVHIAPTKNATECDFLRGGHQTLLSRGDPGVGATLLVLFVLRRVLPLCGTVWLIAIVYLVARPAFATRAFSGSLLQLHRELEEAAFVAGLSIVRTAWRVVVTLTQLSPIDSTAPQASRKRAPA